MGKIIFLDIDGTLRDFDGLIPESAVRAVRAARAAGHKVCISSGRPVCQIDPRVLEIGFDGVVSSAGGTVSYGGECLSRLCFPPEAAEEICWFLIENGCLFEFANSSRTAVLRVQESCYREMNDRIQRQLGLRAAKLLADYETLESVSAMPEIEKIMYFTHDLRRDRIVEAFGNRIYTTEFQIPGCGDRGGEITPAGADKGSGVAAVLKASGFRPEEMIAVGDSDNDVEMLKLAAVGVAMGNGSPGVKACADLVTATLREDGLEKAFRLLELI